MAKKKFIPLTGLGDLTEAQREEYKINACEYFDLPPELNLLEFIWMDSGDGSRTLALYARKGATDMLRSSRGICVDTMKETIGADFIMFTATGHDKTGRVDVAVGAADTKGRSGKYLTNAIMTAQTRASRRLTLQFVGGGLLDESEVEDTTSNLSQANRPLAEIAAPAQLSPNPAPGRDITQDKEALEKAKAAYDALLVEPNTQPLPVKSGKIEFHYTFPAPGGVASPPMEGTTVPIPVVEAPKKRRRRSKSEISLEAPLPAEAVKEPQIEKAAGRAWPEYPSGYHAFGSHEGGCDLCIQLCQICYVPIHQGASPSNAAHTININADGTPHTCPSASASAIDPTQSQKEAAAIVDKIIAKATAEAPLPPVLKDQPTDVQKGEFKKRLFAYTNDVLCQGKMVPCEGIGGIENKMKAFVRAMLQTQETKNLTVNQWETFLGYLDEKFAELGAEGLVKLINEKIGAKE